MNCACVVSSRLQASKLSSSQLRFSSLVSYKAVGIRVEIGKVLLSMGVGSANGPRPGCRISGQAQ